MPTILSTKKLTKPQQELLNNAHIPFQEYDAIQLEFLNPELPRGIKNAIFTSKNAVKAILNKEINIENCFCVGKKTKALLEKNKVTVVENANSASALAEIIKQEYSDRNFTFICGNKRRNELPKILINNTIAFEEITTYKTTLVPKKFNQEFDGIMFFSPSGVQSFTKENSLKSTKAFCIGNTTAFEAKKHTTQIIIANQPSVENVIVQVIKAFKK